jgi:hypothetical protein
VARFRGKSEFEDLERDLRAGRPEPSDELIRALSSELTTGPSISGLAGPRLAFAAALSVLLLAAFGAFGGFGYASKAASGQITAFTNLKGKSSGNVGNANNNSSRPNNGGDDGEDDDGPDDDQYKPGKGCGDKNHIHERENECKKPPK